MFIMIRSTFLMILSSSRSVLIMNDYIEINKIWMDPFCFELEIICASNCICVRTKTYTSEDRVNDLYGKLKKFINGKSKECLWKNGEKGSSSAPYISFRFIRKDKLGHILIEIYLEIDDGGTLEDHHCCFYVNTELGLLSNFCKNLPRLNKPIIGTTVILNDVD